MLPVARPMLDPARSDIERLQVGRSSESVTPIASTHLGDDFL